MKDLVIIGQGPAGVSAAIYAARAGIKVTVIAKDLGVLKVDSIIENYYGFEPIQGKEIVERGIRQAKNVGVEFINDEVVGINFEDTFVLKTTTSTYQAKALIIATGASRTTLSLPKVKEYEGKGISYCATCDAFFYRGKDVGVVGASNYALNEASELLTTSKSVTIFTNGALPTVEFPNTMSLESRKIKDVFGDTSFHGITLDDNTTYKLDGLFLAIGSAGSTELARKIGIQIENNKIVVGADMETNIPGIFAAGDCVKGIPQIVKAAHDGAIAGIAAMKYLRKNKLV